MQRRQQRKLAVNLVRLGQQRPGGLGESETRGEAVEVASVRVCACVRVRVSLCLCVCVYVCWCVSWCVWLCVGVRPLSSLLDM